MGAGPRCAALRRAGSRAAPRGGAGRARPGVAGGRAAPRAAPAPAGVAERGRLPEAQSCGGRRSAVPAGLAVGAGEF